MTSWETRGDPIDAMTGSRAIPIGATAQVPAANFGGTSAATR